MRLLTHSVYEKFYKITGVKLMEGFGQTETTMTLGTMPWHQPKPGSMGKPNHNTISISFVLMAHRAKMARKVKSLYDSINVVLSVYSTSIIVMKN